jgi:cell division protein FtsB
VVVRGPDGKIVDPARTTRRPRRIPGAPGAVLLAPTLLPDAADGREERRSRRRQAPIATVTPLPPRRRRGAPGGDAADGDDESRAGSPALLAAAGGALGAAAGAETVGGGDGGRVRRALRSVRTEPTVRRTRRLAETLAGLNVDRLLPADDEARARRALVLRRSASLVAAVALVAMVVYSVFPVRTFLDQRAESDRAREQLEVFEEENDRLEQEAADLRTRERIIELARELGLVLPGEELYGIFPGPEEPAPDDGDQ